MRRRDGIHSNAMGGRVVAAAFLRRLRADGLDVRSNPITVGLDRHAP